MNYDKPSINEKPSLILRRLMKACGNISENELSRRTDVPQPTIHRILMSESKDPKTGTLKPLAEFFGVTLSQMRGEEPIPDSVFAHLGQSPGPDLESDGQAIKGFDEDDLLILADYRQLNDTNKAILRDILGTLLSHQPPKRSNA